MQNSIFTQSLSHQPLSTTTNSKEYPRERAKKRGCASHTSEKRSRNMTRLSTKHIHTHIHTRTHSLTQMEEKARETRKTTRTKETTTSDKRNAKFGAVYMAFFCRCSFPNPTLMQHNRHEHNTDLEWHTKRHEQTRRTSTLSEC